jgi:hypothetical protein
VAFGYRFGGKDGIFTHYWSAPVIQVCVTLPSTGAKNIS